MRQTLFYIPHEVFGLPVFGFGLLLVLWLVASGIGVAVLVRKCGWTSETRGYLPLIALVAAAIAFLLPRMEIVAGEQHLGLPIRGYGVMLLLAVTSGVGLAVHRANRVGLNPEVIYALAFWLFASGIIGARLFYVLQYWPLFERTNLEGEIQWIASLQAALNVTQGGLVVYGSLIGAALAYGVFVWRHRLPALGLADLIAPSMLLGLAIGRIGCLFNGCCFGGVCEAPLPTITFPSANPPYQLEPSPPYMRQHQLGQLHGFTLAADEEGRPVIAAVAEPGPAAAAGLQPESIVLGINGRTITTLDEAQFMMYSAGPRVEIETKQGVHIINLPAMPQRTLPVHPAQIYSSINAFLLFSLLWFYYPLRQRDGEVCALMLSIYPVTRVLLEWVRSDEAGRFGTTFTISQWVSVGLLVAAAILWWWIGRQPKSRWPESLAEGG